MRGGRRETQNGGHTLGSAALARRTTHMLSLAITVITLLGLVVVIDTDYDSPPRL